MMNATEKTGFSCIEKLQTIINQTLQLDEFTTKELGELSGKVISIEFINTRLVVYLFPSEQGVEIRTKYDGDINVRIRGTPTALYGMMAAKRKDNTTSPGNMEIIGDVGLGQRFQTILMNIDIDWEELLSHGLGDTAAHMICNIFIGGKKYATDVRQTIAMDISEYLKYEKDILPDRTIINEMVSAIDIMRNDVERLQIRLRKLENSFAGEC
jgi:ubiquinone biosynthesis protein UbiJ